MGEDSLRSAPAFFRRPTGGASQENTLPFRVAATALRRKLGLLCRKLGKEWLGHHDMVLLRKAVACPLPDHPGFFLVQYDRYETSILHLYQRFDRGFPEDRLRRRFDRGMRFYELRMDDQPMATTWVILRGERFIDEIGLGFPLGPRSLWLRDIFVAPQSRGLGLFAVLLDLVLARMPDREFFWSDVECANRASLRAHARYGYEPVGRYEVVHLLGGLLCRLRWPLDLEPSSSYRPSQRLLLTGKSYRSFIEAGMA